jgi:hypothetical protein
LRLARADQLDAGLAELPLAAQLTAPHAQHLAAVAEPERTGRAPEAGRGDARHLGRDVGPQPHHALADRVHESEGLLRHRGARAGHQGLLELEQRRLDPLVALAGETGEQPLDHARLVGGLGRQDVLQARWQKGPIASLVHGARGSLARKTGPWE